MPACPSTSTIWTRWGAKGVGLFRTEFQFMASETMPGLDEQSTFYKSVIERAGDRPVVFRTIDLGGDKIAPFMGRREREENPALGWRALRMALDHPFFFRRQLRALIRASRGKTLRLMFPMVTTVEEFEAARRLVDSEMEWAIKFGPRPAQQAERSVRWSKRPRWRSPSTASRERPTFSRSERTI
jgi:phosphotransferase system enzyme I (PtsP)